MLISISSIDSISSLKRKRKKKYYYQDVSCKTCIEMYLVRNKVLHVHRTCYYHHQCQNDSTFAAYKLFTYIIWSVCRSTPKLPSLPQRQTKYRETPPTTCPQTDWRMRRVKECSPSSGNHMFTTTLWVTILV